MSNYLINVQRAIAQTEMIETSSHDYAEGWIEAAEDLNYGISLGSEHAVKQQISKWVECEEDLEGWDDNWKGYIDHIHEIYHLIQSY